MNSERENTESQDRIPLPKHEAYDPFEAHFVSQNKKNEFLKSLEQRSED
ncbi:MAG: hypothetical protein KUA37_00480 [Desulfomicrobium sp.]|nr:hypothetical protein [Hoeflea sp.]MBV1710467.1 hypothetical protein [Desulfomicrobium sp.]MBV1782215.1 hypothetical protein [Hoeflea sp.]